MPDLITRFPEDAATANHALFYYGNRATQHLWLGWSWDGTHTVHDWGIDVVMRGPGGESYRSAYVFPIEAGQGHLTRFLASIGSERFVTSAACTRMVAFLKRHEVAHRIIPRNKTPAYIAIETHYGDHAASRSGLHYINHIDEGLDVLGMLGADADTRAAWCIHPLVQHDDDLGRTLAADGRQGRGDRARWLSSIPPRAIMLAMEYRHWANNHLSKHDPKVPTWGPREEVRQMLVADKMQNRRDFERTIRGRPDVPNSDRLDAYFGEWFDALGIEHESYTTWATSVTARTGGALGP